MISGPNLVSRRGDVGWTKGEVKGSKVGHTRTPERELIDGDSRTVATEVGWPAKKCVTTYLPNWWVPKMDDASVPIINCAQYFSIMTTMLFAFETLEDQSGEGFQGNGKQPRVSRCWRVGATRGNSSGLFVGDAGLWKGNVLRMTYLGFVFGWHDVWCWQVLCSDVWWLLVLDVVWPGDGWQHEGIPRQQSPFP